MRILFLTFYYEPDLCAGSFRNTALVNSMLKFLPKGSVVDVVSTLPNRYSSFSADAPKLESKEGVRVRRVVLPTHNSGMLDQSKAFGVYAKEALKHSKKEQYDLVFSSSSRLMTAALGAYIARKKDIPLYLDIRDIFVDTIKDVLPGKVAGVMAPLFSLVEKWTVNRAAKVNIVSEGFRGYFSERYPSAILSVFTNGIDDEFLEAQPLKEARVERLPVQVVYAGNMGEGQGLHNIIPPLAKALEKSIHFRLIGAGGRLSQLESEVALLGCSNVSVEPPVNRKELIDIYRSADVLFLHLNDYEAFKKVLPSKLFEYAALGKPVWAGVGGYAAEFVRENISNSAVFAPCDVAAAVTSFDQLKLETSPRKDFVARFSRENIMNGMALDVISLVNS